MEAMESDFLIRQEILAHRSLKIRALSKRATQARLMPEVEKEFELFFGVLCWNYQ